jgi:hypothetical protein
VPAPHWLRSLTPPRQILFLPGVNLSENHFAQRTVDEGLAALKKKPASLSLSGTRTIR